MYYKFGGESGIRTHGTCEGTHTFQACAENLGLIKQYLFNIETSKIGLDCDQSESRFLTQIWSQIIVEFSYEKTFMNETTLIRYKRKEG